MRAAGARAPKASPREGGPDPHGRAGGISFGGAVLPRGRPATQGQDGSPPIALARGPAARSPFLRCLATKPRKARDPTSLRGTYTGVAPGTTTRGPTVRAPAAEVSTVRV